MVWLGLAWLGIHVSFLFEKKKSLHPVYVRNIPLSMCGRKIAKKKPPPPPPPPSRFSEFEERIKE